MPGGQQPLAPLRLRAPAAHRADVGGVRAQRERERGVVELGVVGEHRDVGGAVDAADAGERLLRPGRDHLLGVGEARARSRTARAGRTTNGRQPAARGQPCRAPPRSRRRRRSPAAAAGATTSTNSVASPASRAPSARPTAAPRPPRRRPRRARRRRARRRCARRRARAASRRCGGPAMHGHERRAAVRSRDAPRTRTAGSRLVFLHEHVDLAAARAGRRPRPRCRRSRSGAAAARSARSTSAATSTTAPSTHPPETAPDTSPCSLTAIFAPGGRGAERFTPTTVAMATLSPRSSHARTSSSTSFISRPPSHQRRPSSSNDAIELPDRKWSTCGSAACMPRVSGS